MKKEIVKLMDS